MLEDYIIRYLEALGQGSYQKPYGFLNIAWFWALEPECSILTFMRPSRSLQPEQMMPGLPVSKASDLDLDSHLSDYNIPFMGQ